MGAEYTGTSPGSDGLRARVAAGRPLLLDGATGTELERRGVPSELPLWSTLGLLQAPETVREVHRAYVDAGVDALTAVTFRTQRRVLERAGLGDRAAELTARAVALARAVAAEASRPVLVLGSAPPLEDCFRPDLVPDDAALAREHAEHARHLVDAGVDAVLAETMNTAREALAAVRAAREAGADAWVSFVCDGEGRLLSGEPLAGALEALAPLDPVLVGVNCLPPRAVAGCLPGLRAAARPFAVYANLRPPLDPSGERRSERLSPAEYADRAAGWLAAGAAAVGGCCGTTPDHLSAVRRRMDERR